MGTGLGEAGGERDSGTGEAAGKESEGFWHKETIVDQRGVGGWDLGKVIAGGGDVGLGIGEADEGVE